MSYAWNYLALLNRPDLVKNPTANTVINIMVKPVDIEMGTAEGVFIGSRRQRLKKLFAQDSAWENAELERLGLSCIKAPGCHPCCTRYECAFLRL